MIKPVLQDDDFIADVKKAGRACNRLHLWWLGQSGYLMLWRDQRLLLDPYLSDSLTAKYAGSDTPHVRMIEKVVDVRRLDFIDVVTSSHSHTDHLDGETISPLLAANPKLIVLVSEANREFAAQRLQVPSDRLTGITCDSSRRIGEVTFNAVPSAHEKVETDRHGHHKYIGFVIEAGPWTIYHAGDTVRYQGMAALLRNWKIDIALLPINGRDPARGVAGNLFPEEAAVLGRDMKAGLVIPCHFDMFEFNTVDPSEFARAARKAGQPFHILKCGERWSSRGVKRLSICA
jgi:L-ascorbate metabolism protein UlaG (beta-lactamase superfamily)